MDVQTRNTKVMEFENLVHWTINKNRPLIRALNLDENDVFQDLMIAAIIAVDRFDSDRSDSLFTHVREKLQYEILNIKGKYRTAGMTGSQGIFVSSVDAYYYNGDPLDIPSDEGGYAIEEHVSERQKLSLNELQERWPQWEEAVIVFSVNSDTSLPENSRSYLVNTKDNFWDATKCGTGLFGQCLDGSDIILQLNKPLQMWTIDYCYIVE